MPAGGSPGGSARAAGGAEQHARNGKCDCFVAIHLKLL